MSITDQLQAGCVLFAVGLAADTACGHAQSACYWRKGLWAAPDRIVNDLWSVVEMTAGFVCALTPCVLCASCACAIMPHSDYYRRADCDRSLIRSWDERWHCLCDCPYWLICTSDLWVTPDYYLSWQLTLLACIHVLIATDRWFAPRGVDKYAVSGAWSCCAFTCGEG